MTSASSERPLWLGVGTSGFAYREWKGSFYPARCRPEEMLPFYAERFRTVEINNTFYRMPRESVLAGWTAQVPDSFRFVLKAPQRITHQKRLREVEDELGYFLRVSSVLGERRGPTLFQLPPNFKKDLPRLEAFLALLPRGWDTAFEFRHASWFDDEVCAVLRGAGVALCLVDEEDGEMPTEVTAPFGYLRLRRVEYSDEELARHAAFVTSRGWERVHVFFKHEDEGTGPALAARFLALADPGSSAPDGSTHTTA